jgi:membrane protein
MSFKGFLRLLIESLLAWLHDRAIHHAAALAFFTIFSLAPLVVLTVGSAELVFHQAALEEQIVALTRDLMGQQVAGMMSEIIQSGRPDSSSSGMVVTLISLGVTLFSASLIFRELQNSLNAMWGLESIPLKPDRKNWGYNLFSLSRKYLITIAAVLSFGFLLILLLVITAVGAGLLKWTEPARLFGPLTKLVIQLISFGGAPLLFMIIFAMTFKFLPQAIIRWRDVWPGAALTAILFWLGGYGISLYLIFSSLSSAYGTASTLTVFLMWVFICAAIVLYGAKFTQLYAERFGVPIRPKAGTTLKPAPIKEPVWLSFLQ